MTDKTLPQPALLPCPFCGEKEVALHPRDLARWGCELPHNGNDAQYAHCDQCGAEGPQSFYEHEAVEAWNRRAPTPQPNVSGLEPIGEIDAGGTINWFKPPIRKGTVLYSASGSTLTPDEIECVCKRAVCTYDADFGCGLDRSKERQDV